MSEFVRTATDTPEMILAIALRDPQGIESLSADAKTFVTDALDTDLQAYRITGDRSTVMGNMPPAFRQDVDCAIAVADSMRLVRSIAGADMEDSDRTATIKGWRAGTSVTATRDLGMLRTAMRHEPISEVPGEDVAAVSSLIEFLEGTAETELRPHWLDLQHGNIIMRANGLPLHTLDNMLVGLVSRLADSCQVEEDPEENLAFWASFVGEGTDVLADEREAQVIKLTSESTARQLARPAMEAA